MSSYEPPAPQPDSPADRGPSVSFDGEREGFTSEAEEAARERIAETVAIAEQGAWYGTWMLFKKEIDRFWGVAAQTIVSPALTTLLYFLVFGYSLGGRLKTINGEPYVDFLVPGLVMLSLINNAFLNSAFSFFIGKIHGIIVDVLVTPLNYVQLVVAYTGAAIVRGMLVGGIIWAIAALMGAGTVYNVGVTLAFMFLTALAFSALGLMIAVVAEDFDHINLLPNFLI
ncbi:MAG: ABC transporter permease, partial [Bradymonadaceae bacterium]